MKYKLLCLDIDDTVIADSHNELTPEMAKALKLASEKIYISFITTRSLSPFRQFLNNSGIKGNYHVVENGAKIYNPKGEIEIDLHIPHEQVQKAIGKTAKYYKEVGLLTDNHWRDDIREVDYSFAVTGMSFTCLGFENADNLVKIIEGMDESFAVYHGEHWTYDKNLRAVFVFHKDATKGNGMKYIQSKIKVSKEQTIAIGNGVTDVSMFDEAGLKVAVENCEPMLKKVADIVCPSVKNHGVSEIIKKYILI